MLKTNSIILVYSDDIGYIQLSSVFENKYNILETSSMKKANEVAYMKKSSISAVIVDITEFDYDKINRFKNDIKEYCDLDIPVIAITWNYNEKIANEIIQTKVADVISMPCSKLILHKRINTIIEHNSNKYYNNKNEDNEDERNCNTNIFDVFSSAIESQKAKFESHNIRISKCTKILLEKISEKYPEYELDDKSIELMSKASIFYDIGKMQNLEEALNKIGKLTESEYTQVQNYNSSKCKMSDNIVKNISDEYINFVYLICYYHNERWDGKGYPEGISGENIPICAQVVGLVDVYESLTSRLSYRKAYTSDKAFNMILNGECGIFSPKLLDCFKQVKDEIEKITIKYRDKDNFNDALISNFNNYQEKEYELKSLKAKYNYLLRYSNVTVLDIDLDKLEYKLIYNPDPNLSSINLAKTYDELVELITNRLILPEDKEKMIQTSHEKIEQMFSKNIKRQDMYVKIRNITGDCPILYKITMFNMSGENSKTRKINTIWKEVISIDNAKEFVNTDKDLVDFAVLETLDKMYSVKNDDFLTIKRPSKDMLSLLEYNPEELKIKFDNKLIEIIHPNDREATIKSITKQLKKNVEFIVEFRVKHSSGKYIWVLSEGRLFNGKDGQEYLYCLLVDITKSKKAEEVLQQTLERQSIILEQTENVIFEYDVAGDKVVFSEKWKEMFGYELVNYNVRERIEKGSRFYKDDIPLAKNAFKALMDGYSYQEFDIRIEKLNGVYIWCQARITVQYDDCKNPIKMIGVIVNIDDEKRKATELQEKAERDSLTNLLNKGAGKTYVEEYMMDINKNSKCALLVIDLDNFKNVNDQYGHLTGDAVIKQATTEIKKLFRADDIIVRIGGDEFMVLMKNYPSMDVLSNRLDKLISFFNTTMCKKVPNSNLGCSIGIALYPEHGLSYQELFKHADQALYQVKSQGKNSYAIYDENKTALLDGTQKHSIRLTPIESSQEGELSNDTLLRYIFKKLYKSTDLNKTLNNMLELIGTSVNVSRVYIFENNEENTHSSNTYEWCNKGISPEIDNLQNLDYSKELLNYRDNFNENGVFYCPDIANLPKEQYEVLEPQGIKSMLQCAIMDNGIFSGFVGFDECNEYRLWTREQIETLNMFSEIVSVFLLKKRAEDKIN